MLKVNCQGDVNNVVNLVKKLYICIMKKIFENVLSEFGYTYTSYHSSSVQYIVKVYKDDDEWDSVIGLDLDKIMLILIKRIKNENSI